MGRRTITVYKSPDGMLWVDGGYEADRALAEALGAHCGGPLKDWQEVAEVELIGSAGTANGFYTFRQGGRSVAEYSARARGRSPWFTPGRGPHPPTRTDFGIE